MAQLSNTIKMRSRNAYVVCKNCGEKHGRNELDETKTYVFWKGRCEICHLKGIQITDFRNYGFSKHEKFQED